LKKTTRGDDVTISHIAKLAGVSESTASRAINDKPDINAETKERVLNVVKDTGYTPNFLAQGLRSRKTKTIGVIISDISNPVFGTLVKGIEDVLRKKQYSIILSNTDEKYEREEESIGVLIDKRVDGLLITPVGEKDLDVLRLKQRSIPFVLVARHLGMLEAPYVVNDDELGGFLATRYLLDKGHKRILYISGPLHISSALERLAGYRRAFIEQGQKVDQRLIKIITPKMDAAYRFMKRIFLKKPDFTAIFAFSDFIALGVMKALHEQGFAIPEDIAVVGFDDVEISSALEVPLTTVHMPRYRLGKKSAELLLAQLLPVRSSNLPMQIVIKPELIVRKSA